MIHDHVSFFYWILDSLNVFNSLFYKYTAIKWEFSLNNMQTMEFNSYLLNITVI